MSRVGKNPVAVPSGVDVTIANSRIAVKGKLGQFDYALPEEVEVARENGEITVKPANDSAKARALWGTTRANISNMVTGVSTGFTKVLEITGVGYRAAVQGQTLTLQLGFSHDVNFPIPEGITIKCEKPTTVAVSGADKQQVGQVCAKIRSYRPPEPYKGKGVRYSTEQIRRKEGKKK
ncbi:MAG: 50S ribosomal protein L6 [Rhodospirillales bacterium]